MKRKISILSIVMVLMLIVSACSTNAKPETTVSEFINAMKNFDFETMSKKMDPKIVEKNEDFLDFDLDSEDPMEQIIVDYIKSNAKKITYDIKESKEDGDNAVVSVNFKYVDGKPVFKAVFTDFMKEALEMALGGEEMTDEEYSKVFMDIMEKQSKSNEETFVEKTIDIKCTKIDDNWYVAEIEDEELLDVFFSNMLSVMEDVDELLEEEIDGLDETDK